MVVPRVDAARERGPRCSTIASSSSTSGSDGRVDAWGGGSRRTEAGRTFSALAIVGPNPASGTFRFGTSRDTGLPRVTDRGDTADWRGESAGALADELGPLALAEFAEAAVVDSAGLNRAAGPCGRDTSRATGASPAVSTEAARAAASAAMGETCAAGGAVVSAGGLVMARERSGLGSDDMGKARVPCGPSALWPAMPTRSL